jgi:hypothetical protein
VHYGVQIALYTDLLRRLNLSAGDYGCIWDVHGRELRYDLHAPLGVRDPGKTIWNLYLLARQAGSSDSSAGPAGRRSSRASARQRCASSRHGRDSRSRPAQPRRRI